MSTAFWRHQWSSSYSATSSASGLVFMETLLQDSLTEELNSMGHSLTNINGGLFAHLFVAGIQLVKNIPAFYITRRLITVFTTVRHWFLPWARWIQSKPSHPMSLKSILLLSSHLHLSLASGLFLQVCRPKFCMHFSYLACVLHAPHTFICRPASLLASVRVSVFFMLLTYSPDT